MPESVPGDVFAGEKCKPGEFPECRVRMGQADALLSIRDRTELE